MGTASSDHIGLNVRARRESAGLSREALAQRAGVSLKTVERLEWGLVEPRRATLLAIEVALRGELAA